MKNYDFQWFPPKVAREMNNNLMDRLGKYCWKLVRSGCNQLIISKLWIYFVCMKLYHKNSTIQLFPEFRFCFGFLNYTFPPDFLEDYCKKITIYWRIVAVELEKKAFILVQIRTLLVEYQYLKNQAFEPLNGQQN